MSDGSAIRQDAEDAGARPAAVLGQAIAISLMAAARTAVVVLLVASCAAAPFGGPPRSAPAPASGSGAESDAGHGSMSTAAVTGIVLNEDGSPAREIPVALFGRRPEGASATKAQALRGRRLLGQGATPVADAITSQDGRFDIPDAPEGTLNLEAVKSEEFKVFKAQVRIVRGGTVNLGRLTLSRTGTIAGRVVGPPGLDARDVFGAEVYIPGTPYLARSDAGGRYTIARVPAGYFDVQADHPKFGIGAASGILVRPGAVAPAPDIVLTRDLPRVFSVTPHTAAPGATVLVRGEHFGDSASAAVTVWFGDTEASQVKRIDGQNLEATVPQGARSGDLAVVSGGIPGPGWSFQVIDRLSVSPERLDLLLAGTASLQLDVRDTAGLPIPEPPLEWSVPPGIELSGPIVRALSPGSYSLTAWSGDLRDSLTLNVYPGQVRAVSIEPDLTIAGYLAKGLRLTGFNLMSDGSTNDAVLLRPLEPTRLGIDASGTAIVKDTLRNGTTLVAVRSLLEPTLEATASVKLWNDTTVETVAGRIYDSRAPVSGRLVGSGLASEISTAKSITVAPDGRLLLLGSVLEGLGTPYFWVSERLFEVGPDGQVSARWQTPGANRNRIVAGADGSLYYANLIDGVGALTADGTELWSASGRGAGFADGRLDQALFSAPSDILVGPDGTLLVADTGNFRIRAVSPAGSVETVAGGSEGMADGAGPSAQFLRPAALAPAPDGSVFVGDATRIRKVSLRGVVITVVGSAGGHLDGPAAEARFMDIKALAAGSDGMLYVADGTRIRRVDPEGNVRTLAGTGEFGDEDGPGRMAKVRPTSLAFGPDEWLYFCSNVAGGHVRRLDPRPPR